MLKTSDITELTPKYIVIPYKYVKDTNVYRKSVRITLNDEYAMLDGLFSKGGIPYFVMKLDDEFNINEMVLKLNRLHHTFGTFKIKGYDLALIILNSITDKSKLE